MKEISDSFDLTAGEASMVEVFIRTDVPLVVLSGVPWNPYV
jgi:hypothetical protein